MGGIPKSIRVEGWNETFRVVFQVLEGKTVYVGLSDRGANHLLCRWPFVSSWCGEVCSFSAL